ncbi:dihydroxyacetone kinase subunit DhaL [Frigoribacterium sp. CFBP 13712]|uniref:dihydroxyacetone kinase subunit DhaL n=1 Tax=Frigoribacterium sp. CFBP 13712 TaxID=2775309 RepID=UPI00177CBB32|nr:dihydroxyacetone kinase subunit DhaL [Frigoribacterium sp. CFBP 13712]MBD8703563.1 dihydroxyacetone kinase subunit L [Frigoribacterium sp. CFBP 13712]
MTLDSTWVRAWIERTAEVLTTERHTLSELDRQIGDGDHGENLARGFAAVRERIGQTPDDATPATLVKLVATTLISTVGGAAGPLLGTAYLKGAAALGDASELDARAVVALLTAARDGVVLRGKAETGDKTMVDAWTPAVDAAAAAAESGATPADVLRAAADAAAEGAAATEPLVARKGRASYLGDRAIGHRDPGAQSSSLIITAAADTAAGSNKES